MMEWRTQTDSRARGEWQGMNWIRQEKRLAIYLRDGLACAWCGDSVENGAALTLDHVRAHSNGGSNHETNLVTACERCNKSRGNRSIARFARAIAEYLNHDAQAEEIIAHVRSCARRSLAPHKLEAKNMLARRGSVARVLASQTRRA